MKIIDMRVRPPFGSYLNALYKMFGNAGLQMMAGKFGKKTGDSALERSMELLIKEMDEAGVVKACAPTRALAGADNSDVDKLEEQFPGRFIGFSGLDKLGGADAVKAIDDNVVNGKSYGIIIEPAFGSQPVFPNDERIFPIYEKCQAENIPVMITWGGLFNAELKYYDPTYIDPIALTFPKMKFALCHGGWPYVSECCQIAVQRANVYLSPDLYVQNAPGCDEFIMAGNYMLKNQVMYGSAYPLTGITDAVAHYLNCGFRDEVIDNIMYNNAAKFIGIE